MERAADVERRVVRADDENPLVRVGIRSRVLGGVVLLAAENVLSG
jgi:hypothetical protein